MDKKIFSVFSRVLIISLLVKIIDVSKNLLIAYFLGVSNDADVYMAIISIPESVLIILGIDTLRGVVNSEFSSLNSRNEFLVVKESYQNLLRLVFWISVVLLVLLYLFRGSIIHIFYPGFNYEKFSAAIEISVVIFPVLAVRGISGLMQSLLNSQKRFYLPIGAQMFISILIIIFMFLPQIYNNFLFNLSYGYLVGNCIVVIILVAATYNSLSSFKLFLFRIDDVTKKVLRSSLAIIVLVIFNQLFNSSKNFFASYFGEGAISALSYAYALPALVTGLIFSSVFSVLLSNLSFSFSTDKRSVSKGIFFNSLVPIFYLVVPLASFLFVFGYDVLVLLYKRGGFDTAGINLTYKLFQWENMSMVAWVIQVLTLSLFLAKKKYGELSVIGCTVYTFGIFFNFLFSKLFGLYGLPIATFVTTLSGGLILLYRSREFFGRIQIYVKKLLIVVFSGIVTVGLLFLIKSLTYDYINKGFVIYSSYLISAFFIGLSLYIFICSIFKINYFWVFLKEKIFRIKIR